MPAKARLDDDRASGVVPRDVLTLAKLRTPQTTWDGAVVPAGTIGTVVEILGVGKAYVLDFVEPYEAAATVEADQLEDAGDDEPGA